MATQIIPAFGNFGFDTTHKGLGIFTADTAADVANGLCQAIMPTGGTFKRLRVRLASAPGAGNSWTLALAVNGVDSALSATVSGTATEVTIDADVAVSAGDLVRYSTAKAGSPSNIDFIAALEFEPTTAGEYVYGFGGSAGWNSAQYSPAIYGQTFSSEDAIHTPVCAGTVTRMDVNMADGVFPYSTTPGTGNTIAYTIEKNGVLQDGSVGTVNTTVSCSGATNTGSATFSLSVSDGDLLRIVCVVTGTPGVRPPAGTLIFQATKQLFGQCGVGNGLSTTPAYAWIVGSRSAGLGAGFQWSATEADRQLLTSAPFTATGLIIGISASEVWTSTDSATVTLRVNGVDTALTVTITNPTRTATISGSIAITAGDLLSFKGTATNARTPGVWATLVGTSTFLTKKGCLVAGVNTTVKATRAIAFGLDGNTNVLSDEGKFKVFGDFEVTGTTTLGTVTPGSAALDDLSDVTLTTPATGDRMQYNGSAWVNSGATGGVQWAEVALTSSDLLALRATPKTLVAAPGAGKLLEFVGGVLFLDATATAYVESSANLAVKYTNGSGAQISDTIEATGFIDQTADTMTSMRPKQDAIVAKTGCENQALVLHNLGAAEYTTGTGTLRAKVAYRVWTTGW